MSLDLETLGYQPIMPKNIPEHWTLGLSHPSQHYTCNFTTHLPSRCLSGLLDMPWILSQIWCYQGVVSCTFWRASNEPRSTWWTCTKSDWLLRQSWNNRRCCGTYTSKHKVPSYSACRHHLCLCPPQLHSITHLCQEHWIILSQCEVQFSQSQLIWMSYFTNCFLPSANYLVSKLDYKNL